MTFSSTQTTHIFALIWFLTVVELVSKKQYSTVIIIKLHLASNKNKAHLSLLNQFNIADYIKIHLLAYVDSQKAYMHANFLTPKPLGVIFITASNIFYNTQQISLICPSTGTE